MDELIKELRIYANDETDEMRFKAADAIEQLIEERDAYRKAMTHEHNRAATLAWEKEHCWIPVTERLPKLDENVLVYSAHSGFIYIDANIHFDRNATHWMPLPSAPTEE